METTVTAACWQAAYPYEDDAQAQRFFDGDETWPEPVKSFKQDEEIGVVVKELSAYLTSHEEFTTWYVVRDTSGAEWLIHCSNVRRHLKR